MCVVVTCLGLAACGHRDAPSTGEALIEALIQGDLSTSTELFSPQPSANQVNALEKLHKRCTFDTEEMEILPSGVTPQMERFFAVAQCDGEKRLLGATLTMESADPELDDADFLVSPEFLPGGDSDGEFSREGLPSDWSSIEPLTAK